MLRLGLIGVGHGSTLLQANLPEHDDLQVQVTPPSSDPPIEETVSLPSMAG